MKADLSRNTHAPAAHRRTVRFQQGRVPLDADLNEAQDIAARRVETEAIDVIGEAGGPEGAAGFAITVDAGGQLHASAGRYYVHGLLCELDAPLPLTAQPDQPGYALPNQPGIYVAFVDASLDHVTALDDPSLLEIALHGADTTTRQRVKAQVRLLRVSPDVALEPTCATAFPLWDQHIAPPTGLLAARAEPEAAPQDDCSMTPGAGYRGLLNQLYRVEIHGAGNQAQATYKWSRENGSIVSRWLNKVGDDLVLAEQGRDNHRALRPGGWVELIDRERELREEPGTLVRVLNVRDNVITIDPATATGPVDLASFQTLPRVRRWESAGALALNQAPDGDGFSPLEHGVQVRFAPGSYRTGDYWLMPARAATGDIEWPRDAANAPLLRAREGVHHHFARLALLRFDGAAWSLISDCRKLFKPLTALERCDLKLHNKHLHGSGVVCGLQVRCGGEDRMSVFVRPGHALDCDGNDILLRDEQPIPVVEQAVAAGLLQADGDADLVLTLEAGEGLVPSFGLRAAEAEPKGTQAILKKILEGTIWSDFYEDCVKPLADYLREQWLTLKDDDDAKMSVKRQRTLTLANLLAHRAEAPENHRLWLARSQHAMLAELYAGLIERAGQSQTMCAPTAFAAFPAFPFERRPINVAFLPAKPSGVRMTASGERVLSWSDDAPGQLFVVDGRTGRLIRNLELPGAATHAVQDVALFGEGRAGSAVVAATNALQTVLITINLQTLAASAPVTIQNARLTKLLAHPRNPQQLLALQIGEGVHVLNLRALRSRPLGRPAWAFNAVGHLAINGDMVCATSAVTRSLPAGTYDAVRVADFGDDEPRLGGEDIRLSRFSDNAPIGSDGLALAGAARGLTLHVIAEVTKPAPRLSGKVALAIDARRLTLTAVHPLLKDDDGELGPVTSLALGDPGRVVYAFKNRNQLQWIAAAGNPTAAPLTIPAQAQPVALATGAEADFFAVANHGSLTLTLVPNAVAAGASTSDSALDDYRDALVSAFTAVAFAIAQRLKDCLCDHLLVDCLECDNEDHSLPLAKLELRNGRVDHICNFERKEVLTFPKVKYWLSAVPLIPLIEHLVESVCCAVIKPPAPKKPWGPIGLAAVDASFGIAHLQQDKSLGKLASAQASKVEAQSKLGLTRASRALAQKPFESKATTRRASEVLEQDLATATAELNGAGVEIARTTPLERLVEGKGGLADISRLPSSLRAGQQVELFTRGGKVAFFRVVEADAGAVVTTPVPAEPAPVAPAPAAPAVPAPAAPAVPAPAPAAPVAPAAPDLSRELADLRAELTRLASDNSRLQRELSLATEATSKLRSELTSTTAKLRTDLDKVARRR